MTTQSPSRAFPGSPRLSGAGHRPSTRRLPYQLCSAPNRKWTSETMRRFTLHSATAWSGVRCVRSSGTPISTASTSFPGNLQADEIPA